MEDYSKPDWRHGFREQTAAYVEQFKIWRQNGLDRVFEVDGYNVRVCDMDENDILSVSRSESTRDSERAINEWNSHVVTNHRKHRRGQGY